MNSARIVRSFINPDPRRKEFENFLKTLQLSEGEELSPVHQIYCPLIEALWCGEFKTNPQAPALLGKLKRGEILDIDDYVNDTTSGLNKLIEDCYRAYLEYCENTYHSFLAVLEEYKSYHTSTGFWGPVRRWWNGHSYAAPSWFTRARHWWNKSTNTLAPFAGLQPYKDFIALIDQIALADQSGAMIEQLLNHLDSITDFTYEQQGKFLDELYVVLVALQEGFAQQRQQEDKLKIKHLTGFFGANENDLTEYYDFIVYGKKRLSSDNPDSPQIKDAKKTNQLIFDVHQIRDQRQEEKDAFDKQTKKLKKSIHHVAQQLGLPSRLRKTSDMFEEFLAEEEKEFRNCLLEIAKSNIPQGWNAKDKEFTETVLKTYIDNTPAQPDFKSTALEESKEEVSNDFIIFYRYIEAAKLYHANKVSSLKKPNNSENEIVDEYKTVLAEEAKEKIDQMFRHNCLQFLNERLRTQFNSSSSLSLEEQLRDELQHLYHYEHDEAKCKHVIDPDQQTQRSQQEFNANLASVSAKATSIGEGCVAALLIATAAVIGSPLVVFSAVFFAGYYINNLLFRGDNKSVLDAIFLKKNAVGPDGVERKYRLIFLDKNGKPLAMKWQFVIGLFGILSLATGVTFGALSFVSSFHTLPTLLGLLSIANFITANLPTIFAVLQIASAAFPALAMAISITSIFYNVVADFIRENRAEKIATYFRVNFLLKNGNTKSAFWSMERKQQALHIAKCIGRCILLGIALAVTAAVTIFSAGFLYKDTLAFLNLMANWNPMATIAWMLTVINSLISSPFQVDGANKVLQPEAGFTFSKVEKVNNANEYKKGCGYSDKTIGSANKNELKAEPTHEAPGIAQTTEEFSSPESVISTDSGKSENFIIEENSPSTPSSCSYTEEPPVSLSPLPTEDNKAREKPKYTDEFAKQFNMSINYIREVDGLYYLNKQTREYRLITADPEKIKGFQEIMVQHHNQTLEPDSKPMKKIIKLLNHTPDCCQSPLQKDAQTVYKFEFAATLVTATVNGVGYSYTTLSDVGKTIVQQAAILISGATYSAAPNGKNSMAASREKIIDPRFFATKTPEDLKSEGMNKKARWRCAVR